MIRICEECACSHGLLYNVKKSQWCDGACPQNIPPVLLNSVPVERVERFKYLRHVVTADLKDNKDSERERRSLAMRANMIARSGAVNTNMKIRAGSTTSLTGGTVVELADVVKHPDYAEEPRTGDIAVVFAKTPLGLSNVIDILYLPPAGTFIPDGHEVKVVSWGFEYEGGPQLELLKTILLNKVGFEECVASYAGNERVEISDNVICAYADGRGICNGDSGAPMVIGQVAVGISSFFKECGSDLPDVFTRIDRYTPWILEVATGSYSDAVGVKNVPVRL